MALNLNKVVLAGRLTADVELKTTANGTSVCSFTLAVNRRFQKEGQPQADFISSLALLVCGSLPYPDIISLLVFISALRPFSCAPIM